MPNQEMNFEFKKPLNWSTLPLYKKVEVYGRNLNNTFAPYVDKLQVKPIVINLCPQIKVARLVRELRGPTDISEIDINPDHLLKASHGSGWFLDFAKTTNINHIKIALMSWNQIYSQTESQYKFLRPRFFIEEKIPCRFSGKTGKAHDLKMHCIKGQPYFFLLRKDQYLRNYYDINWKPVMPLEFEFTPLNQSETAQILEICRILSQPFEYVRVDLYIGTDGIYFSEYTFTPHGGKQRLSDEVEEKYGKLWCIKN